MEKRYLEPEMEVVTFAETDVILASEPVAPQQGGTFESDPVPLPFGG